MSCYTALEALVASQNPSHPSPAAVLADLGTPSTSIAILDHGTITTHCISTVGDNPDTLFQACSISKPITALAAMRLIQQGKLTLDDKVVDLLPANVTELLETPQTKHLLLQVTIRHLLSHTSGFSVHGVPGYSPTSSPSPPPLTKIVSGAHPSHTPQIRLISVPGQAFSYSGGGFTVLQLVLETLTGKSFPDFVSELVFVPLGMDRSCYVLGEGEKNVASAYWTGFTACEDKWRAHPERAAAGLWTTAGDLLKVVKALQGCLKGQGSAILGKELAVEMLTEVMDGTALGWDAPRVPGTIFGHCGANLPSWRCLVVGWADMEHFGGLKKGEGGQGEGKVDGKEEGEKVQEAKDDGGNKIEIIDFEKVYYRKNKALMEDCGICVMTNSAMGVDIITKVIHGISYLKGWVQVPVYMFGYPDSITPFFTDTIKIDGNWKKWAGAWGEDWILESGADECPVLRYRETVIKLVPAAMPRMEYEQGQSIDLVLEGLEMMIRLGFIEGKRVLELWRGDGWGINVLEKKQDESEERKKEEDGNKEDKIEEDKTKENRIEKDESNKEESKDSENKKHNSEAADKLTDY